MAKLLEELPDPTFVQPDDKKAIDALDAAQEAYDALSQRERELLGSRKDALQALRKALTSYQITDGNKAKWTAGENKGLSFVANGYYGPFGGYAPGAYGKFLRVEVDGETLDPEHYSIRSGSTVVTLKVSYLETLDTGKHTLRMVYTDGETDEATFRISQPIGGSDSGEVNIVGILFWAALGLACLVAIVLIVLLLLWRREKE